MIFTTDTTGEVYHTTNPTRLVDTRSGIGGKTGTITAGTTSSPSYTITPATVDLITTRIYAAVNTIRTVHDDVDAADPSTSDLLHEMIDSLEKAAWMHKSENRKI